MHASRKSAHATNRSWHTWRSDTPAQEASALRRLRLVPATQSSPWSTARKFSGSYATSVHIPISHLGMWTCWSDASQFLSPGVFSATILLNYNLLTKVCDNLVISIDDKVMRPKTSPITMSSVHKTPSQSCNVGSLFGSQIPATLLLLTLRQHCLKMPNVNIGQHYQRHSNITAKICAPR